MTVTKDQAQMLTTLACASRPVGARQWNAEDVMTEIAKLHDRALPAVVCAVIRAAMDRGAERPSVIGSAGSHWTDTMVAAAFVPSSSPPGTRCTVCGKADHKGSEDHPFTHPAQPDPDAYVSHVAELRAKVAPTSGPTERRTLEDMAAANPELHARLQAVREANPGLAAPPMREPEPEEGKSHG